MIIKVLRLEAMGGSERGVGVGVGLKSLEFLGQQFREGQHFGISKSQRGLHENVINSSGRQLSFLPPAWVNTKEQIQGGGSKEDVTLTPKPH